MKTIMSSIIIVFAIFNSVGKFAAAGESVVVSEEDIAEVKRGAVALHDFLAKLTSWEFDGNLIITTQEEYYNALKEVSPQVKAADKVVGFRTRELRRAERWMMISERLGKDDTVVSAESFFLSESALVQKMVGASATASISSVGADKGDGVPGNRDTVLSIYSFLKPDIKLPYIPHIEPSVLSSRDGWAALNAALPEATVGKGGAVKVTLKKGDFKLEVEFTKVLDGSQRWPSCLRMFTKDNLLAQEINVAEFFIDAKSVGLPKKMTLDTFSEYAGKSLAVAKWEYTFTKVAINQEVKLEEVTFDPASVESIWDVANKVYIHVPH